MCTDCDAARDTRGHWSRFDPACLWCGARLIQQIKSLTHRPAAERSARCKAVLTDWAAYGHSESELRELVSSGSMSLAPPGQPDRQTPTKPR